MVDVQTYYKTSQDKMESAIHHLDDVLSRIRAGKANVRILDGVKIDYYGTPSPLANVATVTTPDARTISIQPWDRKMISDIEKAIMASDVGITPENNGEIIRLSIPALTEERRKTLVKQTRSEGEDIKVRIRNIRREIIEALKKEVKNGLSEDSEKDAEAEVQKIHDKYIKKVDELLTAKEKEIMTV